jgi:alpha-glucosidase
MKVKHGQSWGAGAGAVILGLSVALTWGLRHGWRGRLSVNPDWPKITGINPPEDGFYAKEIIYGGIPIKAPSVVADDALYILYDRLARETAHLPQVVANLAAAKAEVHIIGRNQVTTDLPEWRQDKHVPLEQDNGLTRDQRTRGMGGLITSCGEENILGLLLDRYRGSDICMHEFAHAIENYGVPPSIHAMFDRQFAISKSKGRWINAYAGSNSDEYFAELTMWYFGTHGDRRVAGPRPQNGREGLQKYDPEAYKLFDDFYGGRIEVASVPPPLHDSNLEKPPPPPRDSLVARAVVAKLTSYRIGQTRLADFFADAGMVHPTDPGADGWHVTETSLGKMLAVIHLGSSTIHRFQVSFRDPARAGALDRPLAHLEFKDGTLAAFGWDN